MAWFLSSCFQHSREWIARGFGTAKIIAAETDAPIVIGSTSQITGDHDPKIIASVVVIFIAHVMSLSKNDLTRS
jgi:hypothetical protein